MKWLLPVVMIALVGCSDQKELAFSTCPTPTNYSDAFMQSEFIQGWQVLHQGEDPRAHCREASSFFLNGVNNTSVFELSTLYLDYCSETPQPDALTGSSIHRSEKLPTGVDYDEFKWVLELALCNSPVEQYALGKMLLNGFITAQDTDKGIYFLNLAARQDHIQAQLALADALVDIGEDTVAQQWKQRALDNGASILSERRAIPLSQGKE